MILFLTDGATFSEIKPHPSYSFLSGKPRGAFLTNWDGNSLLTTAAGCFHWEAEGRGVSGVPRLSQRGAATHWAIARRRDGHTDGGGPGGAALRMVRGQGRRTGAPPLPRLSGHPGGECGRPPGSPLRASLSRRGGRGQRDGCLPEPPPGLRAPPPLRLSPLFGGVPGGRPTGTFDCLFLTDSIESPPGQLYYRIDLFRQIK